MKMYPFILLLISFFIFNNSCFFSQSSKKQPYWVQKYPVLDHYYIGVAKSSKSQSNYKELAKQNALNNLSNSISVNVSVVSVFAQNETNKKFTEEFNEVTKTQTKNYIEGYEIEGEWENKKDYWIFLKINKQKFTENKERRKKEATFQAYDLYKIGQDHDNKNQIQLALFNYTRALSILSPFLSESIVIDENGKSLFLANQIVNQVTKLFKEINIKTPKTTIKTSRGQEIKNVELTTYRGNDILAYIPLRIESKDANIVGDKHQSNKEGKYVFSTSIFFQTDQSNYYVACSVNFESLLLEATKDNLIINLFLDINPNVLNFNIENSASFMGNSSFPSENSNFAIQTPNWTTFKTSNSNEVKASNFKELCLIIEKKLISDQVEIIKYNAPNLPLKTKDLATLISKISFDSYKIQVVEIYLPYLTDNPKNIYEILSSKIVFDNSKPDLIKVLNNYKK